MGHGLKVNILGLCGAVLASAITVGCASAPPLRTEGTTSSKE